MCNFWDGFLLTCISAREIGKFTIRTISIKLSYLLLKINTLEGQLKRLEEKDDEMKKMIEERDDKVNLLAGQVKNLSAKLENFQGHTAIEPA